MKNLPARGPFLLLANHSAGLGVAESFRRAGAAGRRRGERDEDDEELRMALPRGEATMQALVDR